MEKLLVLFGFLSIVVTAQAQFMDSKARFHTTSTQTEILQQLTTYNVVIINHANASIVTQFKTNDVSSELNTFSLRTGHYLLKAYSNEDLIFVREISINE